MKFLKDVAGKFFACWAALIFIISLFPVSIAMWLTGFEKEPKKTHAFYRISRVWTNYLLVMFGCELKIKGLEHFQKGENYVVISNHNSMMDITLTTPYLAGPNKTIAKIEISRVPLFGPIYKRGTILVDRKNKNSRADSFNKMKAVLRMGLHMVIYPEGTRNKSDQPMKEFHDGAFRLAIEMKKAILPSLLFNTKKAMPAEKGFYFWPASLHLHFLAPVFPMPNETAAELRDRLFTIMKEYYVTHQPK